MNSHFHFLGICGTAMGAVAAAMARRGFTVTGSDANVYPPCPPSWRRRASPCLKATRPPTSPRTRTSSSSATP
ncbi:Mur ligase domain-containing protein [Akkermansia massiliensis]